MDFVTLLQISLLDPLSSSLSVLSSGCLFSLMICCSSLIQDFSSSMLVFSIVTFTSSLLVWTLSTLHFCRLKTSTWFSLILSLFFISLMSTWLISPYIQWHSPSTTLLNDFGFLIYILVFLPKANSNLRQLGFPHQSWGKPNPIRFDHLHWRN